MLRQLAIERGLSPHTVAAYRRDLAGYAAVLEARGVADATAISAEDVAAYRAELGSRGLAATSVARHLSAVKAFHRWLVDEREATQNPAIDLRPPKQPMRLPKALSVAQVTAMLDRAGGDEPQGLRDRALVEMLYATGARISELVALDVDDVPTTEAETALVRVTGKGSKQRLVPVGSFARAALEAWLVRGRPALAAKGRGGPALFLGARGGRLTRQAAWEVVHRVAEAAGVSEVSPHSFRHSFATHLLEGGADVRVVQELLGHASVATTQIYTHVTADSLRDMYSNAHPRAR